MQTLRCAFEGTIAFVSMFMRTWAASSLLGFTVPAPGPYTRPSQPLQRKAVWGTYAHLKGLGLYMPGDYAWNSGKLPTGNLPVCKAHWKGINRDWGIPISFFNLRRPGEKVDIILIPIRKNIPDSKGSFDIRGTMIPIRSHWSRFLISASRRGNQS